MVEAHIGQRIVAELEMRDAQGNVTDHYDEAHGIIYQKIAEPDDTSQIADEDAEPKDAEITPLRVHADGEDDDVFQVEFDGRRGPEEELITLVSEPLRIVPGEATGGELRLVFRQQASA